MSTEPTPATPQAGAPVSTPAPGGPTITPEPQAGEGQETISLEEARKLRKENQTLRQRQKAIDDAKAEADALTLSESEKANKRAADAEAKNQQYQKQLVVARVESAAQKKNIIDPEMAALALQDKLEFGDDGMPTNLDKALDELIKNKPYLVKAADAQPASPAQTNTPALPAMNPGRSAIQSPGSLPPGKPIRLSDVFGQH